MKLTSKLSTNLRPYLVTNSTYVIVDVYAAVVDVYAAVVDVYAAVVDVYAAGVSDYGMYLLLSMVCCSLRVSLVYYFSNMAELCTSYASADDEYFCSENTKVDQA